MSVPAPVDVALWRDHDVLAHRVQELPAKGAAVRRGTRTARAPKCPV